MYTKGNWKVAHWTVIEPTGYEVWDNTLHLIARVNKCDEDKDNANLIAASPDMYQALKELIENIESSEYKETADIRFVKQAKQALLKAEGKEK